MKTVEFYIHKELLPDENCISLTQAYQEGRMSLKRIIEEWGIHLLSNGAFAASIVLALALAVITLCDCLLGTNISTWAIENWGWTLLFGTLATSSVILITTKEVAAVTYVSYDEIYNEHIEYI